MKRIPTTALAAAAFAMIATGLAAGLTTDAGAQDAMSAIKTRIDLMKANGGALKKIGQTGDPKAVVDEAKTIRANVEKLATLWPEGSTSADSRAKPEIWQNMGDFKEKLGALQQASVKMVSAAEAGNADALKAAFDEARGTCGGCHRVYRAPENK